MIGHNPYTFHFAAYSAACSPLLCSYTCVPTEKNIWSTYRLSSMQVFATIHILPRLCICCRILNVSTSLEKEHYSVSSGSVPIEIQKAFACFQTLASPYLFKMLGSVKAREWFVCGKKKISSIRETNWAKSFIASGKSCLILWWCKCKLCFLSPPHEWDLGH